MIHLGILLVLALATASVKAADPHNVPWPPGLPLLQCPVNLTSNSAFFLSVSQGDEASVVSRYISHRETLCFNKRSDVKQSPPRMESNIHWNECLLHCECSILLMHGFDQIRGLLDQERGREAAAADHRAGAGVPGHGPGDHQQFIAPPCWCN